MSAASPCLRIDSGHELDELVLHALLRSPYAGRQVQADLIEGAVVLRGSVRSYFQKQMVQESLLPFVGATRVVNKLVVAAN
jgi:hypothetical protein